eukprot:scaffold200009_cov36-Tisochrysis_lutea.AAC.1
MPLRRSTDHGASDARICASRREIRAARERFTESSSFASDGTASASRIITRVRFRRAASSTSVRCANNAIRRCLAVRLQSFPPPGRANVQGSRVASSPLRPAGAPATLHPAHSMIAALRSSIYDASKTVTRCWIDGHHTRRPSRAPCAVCGRQLSL